MKPAASTPGKPQAGAATPRKQRKRDLSFERKQLPIYAVRDQMVAAIRENENVVVVGETGSGKTTRNTSHPTCLHMRLVGCFRAYAVSFVQRSLSTCVKRASVQTAE
jgi:hypothetical protein